MSGIKDAAVSFPAIMRDPHAVSISHVKVPNIKVQATNALAKGVVIKVSRHGGLYDHYGIYISDSDVVHYNNRGPAKELSGAANRVIKTTLKEFMAGSTELKVVTFPETIHEFRKHRTYRLPSSFMRPETKHKPVVSPNANSYKKFTGAEVAERALLKLGEGGYDFLLHNCEHFAVWCATGVAESIQVQRVLDALLQTPIVYAD
ncbi:lecithin retinol acyltransferase family protein [Paraburkholderia caledonica]|uniref:lecithin retinol acyltransferase family protein n=1 Tax=Paraburkholderia caledonica TaxID=134536 RepID=UPI0038B6FD44